MSLPDIAMVILWVSVVAVCYPYVLYPAIVYLLSRRFGKAKPAELSDAELPTVSLLVAAHNEASVIEERVRNALAMDYPKGKLEICIATDGCKDDTAARVRPYLADGVTLIEYPVNRGKATVLNETIPQLTGEIVLLSDANTFTEPDALRKIVRSFRDPEVGAVCGRLVLTDPTSGKNADSLYWKYETFLKKCESRLGALLGANGGIYAIRKQLVSPIPSNTILDDFVIPLAATVRTGCRVVYDEDAVANEETPATVKAEFHRRSRIGAGGFQSLGLLWKLLNPARGWVAFTFFSHKLLRWVCPFFLISLFVSNLFLIQVAPFTSLFFCQVAFYAAAGLLRLVPSSVRWVKPLRLTTMFASMNAALLVGFWRWVKGIRVGTWTRTDRTTAPQPA